MTCMDGGNCHISMLNLYNLVMRGEIFVGGALLTLPKVLTRTPIQTSRIHGIACNEPRSLLVRLHSTWPVENIGELIAIAIVLGEMCERSGKLPRLVIAAG